jgi:hypothetical protein
VRDEDVELGPLTGADLASFYTSQVWAYDYTSDRMIPRAGLPIISAVVIGCARQRDCVW